MIQFHPLAGKLTLVQALLRLGFHEDEVHRTLRDDGIVGLPRNACNCPLANYLKMLGFSSPNVRGNYASVGPSFGNPESEVQCMIGGAHRFMMLFDAGAYQDLVLSTRP